MRTPIDEREIHIGGYTYDEDGKRKDTIEIYTSDYSYMLKFDRLCDENPDEWRIKEGSVLRQGGDIVAKTYICPVSCVSFRRGKKKLTDEQREALADSLRAINRA